MTVRDGDMQGASAGTACEQMVRSRFDPNYRDESASKRFIHRVRRVQQGICQEMLECVHSTWKFGRGAGVRGTFPECPRRFVCLFTYEGASNALPAGLKVAVYSFSLDQRQLGGSEARIVPFDN
jgi:hypothetical protein